MISIDGTEFHRNSPWKEKVSLRGNWAHNLSFVPLHQPIILNTLHTHKGKERGKVKCDESHVTESSAQLHVHHTIYTLERLSHETDWSGRQQFSQNHGYWLCFRQNLSWEFGKYSPPLLVMWPLKYKGVTTIIAQHLTHAYTTNKIIKRKIINTSVVNMPPATIQYSNKEPDVSLWTPEHTPIKWPLRRRSKFQKSNHRYLIFVGGLFIFYMFL